MGIENNPVSASDLNVNWPLKSDSISEAQKHLTNIKKILVSELSQIDERLTNLESKGGLNGILF